ncbi:hypothetical protein [Nannocystis pusilla]|uniref:hypothetical protein n=1 Tax=Nannocystis pusilla TaxID=889268 RepID=UPI003B812950
MPTTDPPAGRLSRVLALSLALAGCGVADAGPPQKPHASAPAPFVGPGAPGEPLPLAGRVEERLVAGSYVYLAVRGSDDALRWAVVLGDAPPVGADVALTSTSRRTDFHSPRLGRDFAELHFAILR